jgi:hypothetical protein
MFVGPKINESNLMFGYDVGNHRYFLGEPTTNLLPNAPINAIPKIGNGWGTYNTNQYGNGNFFSIGTVSSVSNNIVTMSSSHSLRTYDVMRPQTTGGGVTANTDYFIKRISSTQFSLHAYNGSQDGSEGYINPTTGNHKVYDSIANDTRISISSGSFPTMWWGAPHLPNSGLVKEIILNGFVNPLDSTVTDCIRQHITRDSGADHMAYNVDASFTPNQPIYCSFWAKSVDASAVGKSINFYHYTYNVQAPNGYAVGCTLGPVGVWQRFGYTFTSPNNAAISYWFNPDGPYKYDIANIQIEQKDHPTRFTTGTRSVTTSLLDKKRNSTLNMTNMSFDSNGSPIFNGTNNRILITNNTSINIAGDITLELVLKRTAGQAGVPIHKEVQYSIRIYDDNTITFADSSTWSYATFGAHGNAVTAGVYHHIVATKIGTTVTIYVDNVVVVSKTFGTAITQTSNSLYIGSYDGSSNFFKGDIPVARIYNRGINATEVGQNFKGYQRRFSLP